MTGTPHEIEWFLAREGQQYGPLTDEEFRKLVELGHLRTEDLVWRAGFADWVPATEIMPQRETAPPPPPPPPPASAAVDQPILGFDAPRSLDPAARASAPREADDYRDHDYDGDDEPYEAPRRAVGARSGAVAGPGAGPGLDFGATRPSAARDVPSGRPGEAGATLMASPRPSAAGYPQPQPARAARPADAALSAASEAIASPERTGSRRSMSLGVGGGALNGPGPAAAAARARPAAEAPAYHDPIAAEPQPRSIRPGLDHESISGGGQRTTRPASAGQRPAPAGVRRVAERPQRRRLSHVFLIVLLLLLVGGAGVLAYLYRGEIAALTGLAPAGQQAKVAPKPVAVRPEGPAMVAVVGEASSSGEVDQSLQRSAVWRLVKRDYPDWYADRLKDAERLVAEKRPQAAIVKLMTEGMVSLRRRHADHAFRANPARVAAVAQTFHDNLVAIAKRSKVACFAFISQGETSPVILELVQDKEMAPLLDAQFAAVFEAITDGRSTPFAATAPRKTDYDLLTAKLRERGWKEDDLSLFSDASALSQAKPEQVCRLVTDWFATHLSIPDEQARHRLLIESIRPVVAG